MSVTYIPRVLPYYYKLKYFAFTITVSLTVFCILPFVIDIKMMLAIFPRSQLIVLLLFINNEYVDKLNTLLSFPLFVQYTGGCLVICNAILHMTILGNTSTSHIVSIIGYTSVTFAQMAAYHWLANEIIYKSDKIIESCYLSNWYELSITSQKCIILLMERAKKPMVLQLYNFIDISLGSLGVVLRWSYSVFALIKARYN